MDAIPGEAANREERVMKKHLLSRKFFQMLGDTLRGSISMKKEHALAGGKKEKACAAHRASYNLMSGPVRFAELLLITTALLFVGAAQAASPVTMTPEIAFIIGPVHDPAKNPWPWFDRNGSERGLHIGSAFPAEPARMQIAWPYVTTPRPLGSGTIAVVNGSTTVTGTGTKFLIEYRAGQLIMIQNERGWYCYMPIASIESDTKLTLAKSSIYPSAAWPYQSQSGLGAYPATNDEMDFYLNLNYYDLALSLYNRHFITRDSRFLDLARRVADSWYSLDLLHTGDNSATLSPRGSSMGGLIVRALDGRPDYWPTIEWYVRDMYHIWVGLRVAYSDLYGQRDSAYMQLYAALLARVHPSQAVRDEFRTKAVNSAVNYYARLQKQPGHPFAGAFAFTMGGAGTTTDPTYYDFTQPMMDGLVLEGLIATHKLIADDPAQTANAQTIANSIVRVVDWLRREHRPAPWRTVWYEFFTSTSPADVFPDCTKGCGSSTNPTWDQIVETRELVVLCLHGFGYAYYLTGDEKYRTWGDDFFSAAFGTDRDTGARGPGGDGYTSLAYGRAKEYNQNYRSAHRYLAYRDAAPSSPIVSISAPAAGATVSGSSVAVSAEASDNVGVVGVQFKLDGANLGAEVTAVPYIITWNTTAAANGPHTLTAAVRDGAGNTTTSSAVSVTVANNSGGGGSSGGGGGGGGCFIATAAYGSTLEPQVVLLQAFRDRHLLGTFAGQAFVQWYYQVSPPVAADIQKSSVLRVLVRGILWPLVGIVWLILHPWIGFGLLLAGGLGCGWPRLREKKRMSRSRKAASN